MTEEPQIDGNGKRAVPPALVILHAVEGISLGAVAAYLMALFLNKFIVFGNTAPPLPVLVLYPFLFVGAIVGAVVGAKAPCPQLISVILHAVIGFVLGLIGATMVVTFFFIFLVAGMHAHVWIGKEIIIVIMYCGSILAGAISGAVICVNSAKASFRKQQIEK